MKKYLAGLSLAVVGIAATGVAKAVTLNLQMPGTQTAGAVNPAATVANFYSFALLISGILAFGAIVWGGIQYELAAGNPSKQGEGKKWVMGALGGILLLVGAYFILNIINPSLINLTLPTLSALPTSSATSTQTQNINSVINSDQTTGCYTFGGPYGNLCEKYVSSCSDCLAPGKCSKNIDNKTYTCETPLPPDQPVL